jgi:hypothetical protein
MIEASSSFFKVGNTMATRRLIWTQKRCLKRLKSRVRQHRHNRNGSAKPVPRKPRARQDHRGKRLSENYHQINQTVSDLLKLLGDFEIPVIPRVSGKCLI